MKNEKKKKSSEDRFHLYFSKFISLHFLTRKKKKHLLARNEVFKQENKSENHVGKWIKQ